MIMSWGEVTSLMCGIQFNISTTEYDFVSTEQFLCSNDSSCIILLSAGVGRTGTFITIDHVLEQIEKEGFVDIPAVIQNLRQQRTTMVQTPV